MALVRRGWEVSFVDPNVSEDEGRAKEAASRKLDAVPDDVDLVVLATPVDVAERLLSGAKRARYTSTCSVMAPLVRAADGVDFIAGHPLAGSEQRGLAAARADLFQGKRWFIHRSDPDVEEMIAVAGASPHIVDADEHDRAIAYTSHLPQLVSTALAALVAEKGTSLEPFYGSGLASILRLAGSDYSVWESVLESNRPHVSSAVEELFAKMRQIGGSDFARAQELWDVLVRGRHGQ